MTTDPTLRSPRIALLTPLAHGALAVCLFATGCAPGSSTDRRRADGSPSFDAAADATPGIDSSVVDGAVVPDATLPDGALPPDGGPVDSGARSDSSPPPADSSVPPVDSGSAPDGMVVTPPPECTTDGECGGGESCDRGYCRSGCLFGFCLDGGECVGSFCVECTDDSDCGSARERCDTTVNACVPQPVDTSGTLIGLFYSTWHCPQAEGNPHGRSVHDISEILAGRQSWGPLRAFHWWDQPEAGYYCLSRNDALLRQHAEQIRDAGVDFIFFDATNHAYMDGRSDRTREMIVDPINRLLEVWSTVPGAPKVVPWVPIIRSSTDPTTNTIDYLLERLRAYPGMQAEYLGKPLIFVTEHRATFVTDEAKLAELSRNYTIRKMWAHMSRYDDHFWSFMEPCRADPSGGERCQQRNAILGGAVEQVSISAAYQSTYMSVPMYATPKHRGLTFRSQFQTLFDNPGAGVATITGWNEWTIQRIPCGEHETCPCSTYSACFLDAYDMEYSRDIEPGRNSMGDYYYRLMQSCIGLYRSGETCATRPTDLCCTPYSG